MVKQELKVVLKVCVVSKLLIYMYIHVYCVYVCFNRIKCVVLCIMIPYSELFSRGNFHDFHELDSIYE